MSTVSVQHALAQAAEYLGFAAPLQIELAGEIFTIPPPGLLDDDQQARYDAMILEAESYDREPDVRNEDGTVKHRGAPLYPARKDGVLVDAEGIRLARAIFGDRFERYRAAGGQGSTVLMLWRQLVAQMTDRQRADSKSDGSLPSVDASAVGDGI